MFQQLIAYMRRRLARLDYQEVNAPQLLDKSLWETSGHWGWYKEAMFSAKPAGDDADDNERVYAIKPMNCPGHIQIFNQGLRSYRDLPMRLAEFGSCHRNEPSGALHGVMRVRAFVQDDAHIFCTEAQVLPETSAFIDLLQQIYADFGFTDILVKLSTRPDKRIGSDEIWDRAERALAEALDAKGLSYDLQPG
jgi:threonyl-tRNA synthetase